jgi:hypothetical protein
VGSRKGEGAQRAGWEQRLPEIRGTELRLCLGMARFRSEAQARTRAREYGGRAAKCRFCDGWHVSKSRGPR